MLRKHQMAICFALVIGLLAAGFAYAKPAKKSSPGKSGGGAVPTPSTPTTDRPATTLPDSVARILKETFPGATIGTVANITDNGLALYSVEIRIGAVLKTVDIAADTTIAKVATLVPVSDAPEAVANTIRDADEKAMITRIQKVEVQCEVKAPDGKTEGEKPRLVALEKSRYYYLGKLFKAGQPGHMTVSEDGKVITALAWEGKPPADPSDSTTTPKPATPTKKKK